MKMLLEDAQTIRRTLTTIMPDATALTDIAAVATLCRMHKGERIFCEGSPREALTFVAHGLVKLVKEDTGGPPVLIDMRCTGESICGAWSVEDSTHCCSAIAAEEGTEVLRLDRAVLESTLPKGGLAMTLLRASSAALPRMCQRVLELGGGRVAQRIARLLLRLLTDYGHHRTDGVRIPLPLTRAEIGQLCGTTVETTSRVLSEWTRQGLVKPAARGLIVTSPEALRAIANPER